jgi:hypothetical protein
MADTILAIAATVATLAALGAMLYLKFGMPDTPPT